MKVSNSDEGVESDREYLQTSGNHNYRWSYNR